MASVDGGQCTSCSPSGLVCVWVSKQKQDTMRSTDALASEMMATLSTAAFLLDMGTLSAVVEPKWLARTGQIGVSFTCMEVVHPASGKGDFPCPVSMLQRPLGMLA